MSDVVLESLRLLVLIFVVSMLWRAAREHIGAPNSGWNMMVVGFALLLFGTGLDLTDNFPALDRFVVIGDTPVEAFLEKIVGYLGGFLFIAIGLHRWIPTVRELQREQEAREKSWKLIEHQATYDALTELPNRRLLLDRLAQLVATCKRHSHFGAAIFIDLDNFKNINDSLGHPVGDVLLKEVARRLSEHVREEDFIARLGGDEFVVLYPQLSDEQDQAAELAQVSAEKLKYALSAPYEVSSYKLHVTISMGIAMIPMADEDANDVLKHADIAMYRAKDAGRNAICFFMPSMQLAMRERLSMQNAIHRAIDQGEFHLHYQPQTDVAGHMVGAEALLRWTHPERGNIGPGEFIPLAEQSGQILAIGEWVLKNALLQMRRWCASQAHTGHCRMSINISGVQFRQPSFVVDVERIVGETGVDPSRITLELTESVLVENLEDAIAKMTALKRLGIRFSIDDFGTGYSSLAYLKRLPVHELKIDRSFVRDVTTDSDDAGLVETLIIMAGHFKLDVVAEGVETEEQLQFLKDRGCRYFQGYLLGRPQSAEDFTRLLQTQAEDVAPTAAKKGGNIQ